MYDHKEMTAHVRKLIKQAGIKARVKMFTACGTKYIQVFTPSYDANFTAEEIHRIAEIAHNNDLYGAQMSPIDPDHETRLTGKKQWNFEFYR